MTLSKFLSEHRASEFGLAPVSKAYAIKMAENLESDRDALLEVVRATQNTESRLGTNTREIRDALAALPEHLK